MPQLLANRQLAKALYNSDRAIAGSGVSWAVLDNATKAIWIRYIEVWKGSNGATYPGSGGSEASLGSATRNNNFVALMRALIPQHFPNRVPGEVTSFTLSPSTYTHAAGSGTQQLTVSAEVDFNGDTAVGRYTYTTDQPTRATVSASGLITVGAATGVAVITATEVSTGVAHICTVTVS